MASKKYEAAKIALEYAKSDSLGSKRDMEKCIKEMKIASLMPADVLANYIRGVYKDNESNRVKGCLEVALRNARGDSINDKSAIKSRLEYAQEHLDTPLSQDVIGNVWNIYEDNEPRRAKGCFKVALKYANKGDKRDMESWLESAQEHSHGLFNNIKSKIREFLIRRKFALAKNAETRVSGAPGEYGAYDLV